MLIFLVGFMGCGKTFTGKHLSAVFDMEFIDMDTELAEDQGLSIPEIFEQHGEPYFRKLETDFLKELDPDGHAVVATGGGAPCTGNNMEIMNEKGVTIFLDIDRETIVERLLEGKDERPLLAGMNRHDLEFFYDRKMAERRPFYEQANFRLKHQDIDVLSDLLRAFVS